MRLSASWTNSRQSIAALLATPVCITVSSMSETTTTRARVGRDVDLGRGFDPRGRQHRRARAGARAGRAAPGRPAPSRCGNSRRGRSRPRARRRRSARGCGRRAPGGGGSGAGCRGSPPRPAGRVGALPEGAADHEDPLGRAVAAIGLQHDAAARRGRCATGRASTPRGCHGAASRLRKRASLRPPAPPARRGSPPPRPRPRRSRRRPASPIPTRTSPIAKTPGQARLERRLARRRAGHRRAGQHEPRAVELERAGPHPATSPGRRRRRGRGCGSAASPPRRCAGRPRSGSRDAAPGRRRAPVISVSVQQLDVRRRGDALDQVARHALVESGAADQQVHPRRVRRRGRPPPGRPSCRRRPAPPRRRRRAAPRSARPSTRPRAPRSARCRAIAGRR